MIETGDLRKGVTLEMDGTLYQVLEVQHIKIGRGSAQVRMKLRDTRAGPIIERTVQSGARFSRARVERQPAQYMYSEGDLHYFMNTETFDQFPLNGDYLGDALNYLKENATCDLLMYGEEAGGVGQGGGGWEGGRVEAGRSPRRTLLPPTFSPLPLRGEEARDD